MKNVTSTSSFPSLAFLTHLEGGGVLKEKNYQGRTSWGRITSTQIYAPENNNNRLCMPIK